MEPFGGGEKNVIPLYSRRIGLYGLDEDEQREIPINAGGKINGRVGNTNIGALVVNTREVDSLDLGDVDEDGVLNNPAESIKQILNNRYDG